MEASLRAPLFILFALVLCGLLMDACQKIDLTQGDDDEEDAASAIDTTVADSAASDTTSLTVDEDYISDTADYRGYGSLDVYLNHYGIDSLHCIPLVDLLEGGWVYEAFFGETALQLLIRTEGGMWIGPAYIVGYVSGTAMTSNTAHFTADDAVQSNVLFGLNQDETDRANCIPVQLSTSSTDKQAVRDACNLCDNPEMLGCKVKFCGDLDKYFSVLGLKSTLAYKLTSDSVITQRQGASCSGEEGTTEDETGTDDDGEEDGDDDGDDDGDGDDATTGTNDFNGYGSIDQYMGYYGWTYTLPVPLADCIAGGCLYEYYTEELDLEEDHREYYSGVWVGDGYIVGYCNNNISSCVFSASGAPRSNILLAETPTCCDPTQCVPVNLLTGSSYEDVRNAYNLADNPDSLGAHVVVCGRLVIKYSTLAVTYVVDAVSLDSGATDEDSDDEGDGDEDGDDTGPHKWIRRRK